MNALLSEFETRLSDLVGRMATCECYSFAELETLLNECKLEHAWLRYTFERELRPCYLVNRFHLQILDYKPFRVQRDDAIQMAFGIIEDRESMIDNAVNSKAELFGPTETEEDCTGRLICEGAKNWRDVRLVILEIGRAMSLLAANFHHPKRTGLARLVEFETRFSRLVGRMAACSCDSFAELETLLNECKLEHAWLRDTFERELRPCYLVNRFHLQILDYKPFRVQRNDAIQMAFGIIEDRESMIDNAVNSKAELFGPPETEEDCTGRLICEGANNWRDVRLVILEIGRTMSLLAADIEKNGEIPEDEQTSGASNVGHDIGSLSGAISNSEIVGFLSAVDKVDAITRADSELKALEGSQTIDYSDWTLLALANKLGRSKKTICETPTYRKWQSEKFERKQKRG